MEAKLKEADAFGGGEVEGGRSVDSSKLKYADR